MRIPERDGFASGTPSWVDVSAYDIDAIGAFYSKVFGWTVEAAGRPDQTGGYSMCTLRGRPVQRRLGEPGRGSQPVETV